MMIMLDIVEVNMEANHFKSEIRIGNITILQALSTFAIFLSLMGGCILMTSVMYLIFLMGCISLLLLSELKKKDELHFSINKEIYKFQITAGHDIVMTKSIKR